MKEDKKVPQLRFPEFTDAWKQRELGEIAERVTRRNSSLESQTPLTISAEYGLIDQNKFFGKRIAAKDLSNYYLIQKGEFAYNKSTSNDAPWGAIKRLDCYNNGALSTLYIVFKIKDNKSCYSDFLVTYYGTSLWHKGVKEIATEGARNHGLLNVSPSDFFRTKLVIPQDFEEQRKIGAFFTQLDNTITLQQRKLNSLQKLKKGLLQKMFPKNGENIPEIRFPEFSDAWKQRKLGEIIDYSNGIGHENYVLPQGKYELVTLKSINSSGKLVCSEKFVNEDFETLKAETLIMMLSEQAKGMLGMTTIIPCDNKYVLNQRVAALKAHNDVEVHFLTNAINNKQNYFEQMGAGTKVQNITRGHVEECVIELPSLEEQKKIGSLFSKLEVTITLQQCKLESLQKLKKGLLQQMFI